MTFEDGIRNYLACHINMAVRILLHSFDLHQQTIYIASYQAQFQEELCSLHGYHYEPSESV